jgi:hypothetical protein
MPSIKIAHIREQGQDLIIVPLDETFGRRPNDDRKVTINKIQNVAREVGLNGKVVPVWPSGEEEMRFLAPEAWHPFFRSITWSWLIGNLNRQLDW